jgi:putative FmdB family regulatory protein
MPIYEYVCEKCGKFEHLHLNRNEPALDKCPKCGSKVEKKISAQGFKFKGYGFYSTDYGKDRPPPPSSTNRRKLNEKRAKLRKEGYQGEFHQKN